MGSLWNAALKISMGYSKSISTLRELYVVLPQSQFWETLLQPPPPSPLQLAVHPRNLLSNPVEVLFSAILASLLPHTISKIPRYTNTVCPVPGTTHQQLSAWGPHLPSALPKLDFLGLSESSSRALDLDITLLFYFVLREQAPPWHLTLLAVVV